MQKPITISSLILLMKAYNILCKHYYGAKIVWNHFESVFFTMSWEFEQLKESYDLQKIVFLHLLQYLYKR